MSLNGKSVSLTLNFKHKFAWSNKLQKHNFLHINIIKPFGSTAQDTPGKIALRRKIDWKKNILNYHKSNYVDVIHQYKDQLKRSKYRKSVRTYRDVATNLSKTSQLTTSPVSWLT